jgi:SPP1 family phage portal protein
MDNLHDTIFYKIRLLQDSYNKLLSDQASIIGDYRNAYLLVTGVEMNEETAEELKNHGLLNLPGDGKASWLMKEMNASYIENMITTVRNSMYSVCNHIDGNEKLQSNTSSLAIRSRLVFLEQRSRAMADYIQDAIYDRIERLFEYLSYKSLCFDIADIKVNFTPNIPVDITATVQAISQLGDKISTETALSLLPFVENPLQEIAKIKKERAELEEIDLDKIGV